MALDARPVLLLPLFTQGRRRARSEQGSARKEPHPMSTPEDNKAQSRRTYEELLRLYKFPV
jgi:hypothetical protein